MIRVLIITKDHNLKTSTERFYKNTEYQFIIFNSTEHPLDIMSQVCSSNPSLLILDDDFISPNSIHLLSSIKKVNPKLSIIFITSNTSLELGRKINSIGVNFYLIKPISESDFFEFVKSVVKEKSIVNY